jgi:nucleoside-diphosphate-sugar epimerase
MGRNVMTKCVLITGGAGFLGSNLCKRYLDMDNTVYCVDNLSTGRIQNIEKHLQDSNFYFLNYDICNEVPELLTERHFDAILNLASPASPPQYQRLAIETLDVGSEGLKNMINLALQNKARFFQASTSEVYGDPEVHPQTETYKGSVNCYGPRSMYDESKRFAEAMIYTYKNTKGLNSVIARFFNTYGPGMDIHDGRVVTNFIYQALTGEPITIYGDGTQTRSFCYVDDLTEGIVRLVKSDEEGPINLGNPSEFTVNELAELVLELTQSSSKINNLPLPGDDPMQRKPDISLALKKLGWQPKVELKEGLIQTIDYVKKQIKQR